jgi:hypothetical protein
VYFDKERLLAQLVIMNLPVIFLSFSLGLSSSDRTHLSTLLVSFTVQLASALIF